MTNVTFSLSMSLDGFVAGPNDEIDPLHESELVHGFERPVHARDPHASALRSNRIVELLRRQAAVLLAEEHDDAPSCSAAAAARIA